jgi:hypothetical protein
MLHNIGSTNAIVIYCHSMVITKVIQFYNTELQYYHGVAVNYNGECFITMPPWQLRLTADLSLTQHEQHSSFQSCFKKYFFK